MIGTVFHYAVVEPKSDHAQCDAQRQGIIAYHERNGYRAGGAYNGHFCIHGGSWLSYEGPNQATGNTWANLNLEAWCYLGTVDTPVTPEAQQTAYELTLRNPRDRIHPHSDFYQTSCCGDPLRAWIAAGALPSAPAPIPIVEDEEMPALLVRAPSSNILLTQHTVVGLSAGEADVIQNRSDVITVRKTDQEAGDIVWNNRFLNVKLP